MIYKDKRISPRPLERGQGWWRKMDGYTLIEVLITLTIFIFMLAITLPQNSGGYTKISFNTYIHDVMTTVRQFQIFGSAAGQIGNTNIMAAGFNFSKGGGLIPYYDKVSSNANTATQSSNLRYDVGEEIGALKLSYAENVKVDKVCNFQKYTFSNSPSVSAWNCNLLDADLLFIRPSTIAKAYIDDTAISKLSTRDSSNAVNTTVLVRFTFLGTNAFRCLAFSSIHVVYEPDQALCDSIMDPINQPPLNIKGMVGTDPVFDNGK